MISPKIFVMDNIANRSIDLVIRDSDGSFGYGVTFAQTPANEPAPVALSISQAEAQALMDRLWTCGLRPSYGESTLAAVGAHLEDMRQLVQWFKELGEE